VKGSKKLGEVQQPVNLAESASTQWSGPLSYASVLMSAQDSQLDWKLHQQRLLLHAAHGTSHDDNHKNQTSLAVGKSLPLYSPGGSSNLQLHVLAVGLTPPNLPFLGVREPPSNSVCLCQMAYESIKRFKQGA